MNRLRWPPGAEEPQTAASFAAEAAMLRQLFAMSTDEQNKATLRAMIREAEKAEEQLQRVEKERR